MPRPGASRPALSRRRASQVARGLLPLRPYNTAGSVAFSGCGHAPRRKWGRGGPTRVLLFDFPNELLNGCPEHRTLNSAWMRGNRVTAGPGRTNERREGIDRRPHGGGVGCARSRLMRGASSPCAEWAPPRGRRGAGQEGLGGSPGGSLGARSARALGCAGVRAPDAGWNPESRVGGLGDRRRMRRVRAPRSKSECKEGGQH